MLFSDKIVFIITILRFLGANGLLFFDVGSVVFWVFYFLCGLSDMLDGYLARRFECESKTGALLDSLADLVFVICCCFKLIPLLVFPKWLWIWAGAIVAIKILLPLLLLKKVISLDQV